MKSLKNLTGGEECSRLVFSSLGPVLEELGTTEILLQSQLYPLNQRVHLTQDRRHCATSLDLADLFHPILHHFHHLYHLLLHLQTSLDLFLSLFSSVDRFVSLCKKLKGALKKLAPPPLIETRSCKVKMKLEDAEK